MVGFRGSLMVGFKGSLMVGVKVRCPESTVSGSAAIAVGINTNAASVNLEMVSILICYLLGKVNCDDVGFIRVFPKLLFPFAISKILLPAFLVFPFEDQVVFFNTGNAVIPAFQLPIELDMS